MKNRILNFIIIILFLIGLFMGGNILYNKYMIECEIYNNDIVNTIISVFKGEKEEKDILSLNLNEEITNNLINYVKTNFYNKEDLILVYEDISSFENIDLANQIYDKIEKLGILSYNGKQINNIDSFNFLYGELDIIIGDTFNDEEIKELEILRNLLKGNNNLNNNENSSDIIVKDNNLYITAYNLKDNLNDRRYKGFNISINELNTFSFTKKFKEDYSNEVIKISNIIEIDKNKLKYVITDSNNFSYTFFVELKNGKIYNVTF